MTTKELADQQSGASPSPHARGRPGRVRDFLQESLPDVHRVDVTKVVSLESNDGGWEADAVVWQPNGTIQALGLSTERPVLDQNFYLVRLDERLNVIGYETKKRREHHECELSVVRPFARSARRLR